MCRWVVGDGVWVSCGQLSVCVRVPVRVRVVGVGLYENMLWARWCRWIFGRWLSVGCVRGAWGGSRVRREYWIVDEGLLVGYGRGEYEVVGNGMSLNCGRRNVGGLWMRGCW